MGMRMGSGDGSDGDGDDSDGGDIRIDVVLL